MTTMIRFKYHMPNNDVPFTAALGIFVTHVVYV